MRFLRKYKKSIILLIVLLIGGFFSRNLFVKKKPEYITEKVKKGDLTQTVSVVGSVVSDIITDLHFEVNGTIAKINFQVGDYVQQGDILAELSADDEKIQVQKAKAALLAAQSNLNLKKAGAMLEDIKVAEATVKSAEVALDIAKTNLENEKVSGQEKIRKAELEKENAEISLKTAETDLKNKEENLKNIKEQNDLNLKNAYDSLKVGIEKNLIKVYEYLIDMDTILGVDDESGNDSFESSLGILKSTSLQKAQDSYRIAKNNYDIFNDYFSNLKESETAEDSDVENLKKASEKAIVLMYLVDKSLLKTRILLNNSVVSKNLTETQLDAFKSTIDNDRIGINTEIESTQTKTQTLSNTEVNKKTNIDNAKSLYETAEGAYEKAKSSLELAEQNLKTVKLNVENAIKDRKLDIKAKEKALEKARASYKLKKAPPRAVDIASLEAQVEQAKADLALAEENLNKTKLIAPSDGTITNINGDIGENVTIADKFMVLLSPQFIIEADVSETDISKIKLNQEAKVTFDAFGEDEVFSAKIFFIDPAETKIQDVIYYKIKAKLFDSKGKEIRSGMTANLDILTAQRKNVLYIPERAIIEKNGQKIVRVLDNGILREARILPGILADGGVIEIQKGLKEGQEVVISIR